MKKVMILLLILALLLPLTVLSTESRNYKLLAVAVCLVESEANPYVYNKREKATGAFQIRPIRVKDYNQRIGETHKLIDFFDYEESFNMFLFYAQGKSFEKAARSWNGSGPRTLDYWKRVKAKLKLLRKMDLHSDSIEAYRLLHEGMLALARAERQGIRVDLETLQDKKELMLKKIARLERKFKETEFYKEWQKSTKNPVNINSLPQLAEFLYKVKGIEPKKFTAKSTDENKKGSTDEDALKQLNIPELSYYSDKSRYKKAYDVLDGFEREQVDGFIHPFFNLHIARTFRSSSNSPNFQNIPIRDEEVGSICRGVLYPRKGNLLLESDFKSVEVAIAACYHKDSTMIKYIKDKYDMHGDMAKQIFMLSKFDKNIHAHSFLRKAAKNGFVFPQFYGDYYKNNALSLACEWGGLSKGKWKKHEGIDMVSEFNPPVEKFHLADHLINNKIKSFDQFVDHIKYIEDDFWNNRFPDYRLWKEKHYKEYLKNGYVDLYTGFRCLGPMSKNDAINYPVQGAAFHCLLWTFIQVDKISQQEKWKSKLIGQIHDSIITDVHPKEKDHVIETIHKVATKNVLEHFKWIIVPLEIEFEICEVDRPWSEKESLKV